MRLALFSLFLAMPLAAQSRDWTPLNRVAASAAGLAIAGDWLTTIDLSRRLTEGHREQGLGKVFMGSQPKLATVHRVFIVGAAVTFLVADRLPSDWRNVFLGFIVGVEATSVFVNRGHGLRFSFRF